MSEGLRITRRFTEAGKDPYDQFQWSKRDSRIANPDGSIVFEMTDAEIPSHWSQVASDIMVLPWLCRPPLPFWLFFCFTCPGMFKEYPAPRSPFARPCFPLQALSSSF